MAELSFSRALQLALKDSMESDPAVVLFGEDVAASGGVFGVSRGLLAAMGEDRVRDTPISEGVIAGMAVGAALGGLRPVVEVMFMDFTTLAMDALVNQAAKVHFMSGDQCSVPMVLRTPHGGGLSAGPQHSQCLEAWFAHVPGLKVVIPGSVQDAYGLLRAAIEDPDPIVFVEHKALYGLKEPFDATASVPPIGAARVLRPGSDLTFVSYGASLRVVAEAAKTLATQGIEAEIIDLRSVQPWDRDLVVESVNRTRRLLVVHEAVTAFGVGAEIAATAAEACFDRLLAPVRRIGADFSPVPFAQGLEKAYGPGVAEIVEAAHALYAVGDRQ